MPEYRNVTSKGNHSVELYSFPEELYTRFATVGFFYPIQISATPKL